MNLEKLLSIIDQADFEAELQEQLSEDPEILPLEDGCTRGGMPDMSDVVVSDVAVTHNDEATVTAKFYVYYTEFFNTSCSNSTVDFSAHLDCTITIDKRSLDFEIEAEEPEAEPEF